MWGRTQFVKTYFLHNNDKKMEFRCEPFPWNLIFSPKKSQIENKEKRKIKIENYVLLTQPSVQVQMIREK